MATIIKVDPENGEVIILSDSSEITITEEEGRFRLKRWRGRRPTESQISMACSMAAQALAEERGVRELAKDIKKPRREQLILF